MPVLQKNNRWEESISLSKHDKLYKDAMETAAVSRETAVAEELLSYFVDIGNKDCFGATLYVCFDLLRPDVVAEYVSNVQPVRRYRELIFLVRPSHGDMD